MWDNRKQKGILAERIGFVFENEPNSEGVLRRGEVIFQGFGSVFWSGVGWLVGLMLRNRDRGTLRREDAMSGRLRVQHGERSLVDSRAGE